jgi:molybdenum cofactor biosynthesis enzyme MoaA
MQVRRPLRALVNLAVRKAPVEAQLIVTRRCNLSCGYCTEYDNVSSMIPLETLERRIDALHQLHVVNISLLGGEPLMHPDLPAIVAYSDRDAQVSVTTNGFLITEDLIRRLNQAGLANMEVSIDSVKPDRTAFIQKCLKTIRPKLALLKRHATFDVHVNLVLCDQTKDDFTNTIHEIDALGFRVSIDLLHDSKGAVGIGGEEYVSLWKRFYADASPFSHIEERYGEQLLRGERPAWHCRAGSRFLYVDEYGNVQFCSAQRGRLGKPVLEYTREDLRAHAQSHKGCESGCSLLCHYRASAIDNHPLSTVASMVKLMLPGRRPGRTAATSAVRMEPVPSESSRPSISARRRSTRAGATQAPVTRRRSADAPDGKVGL